MTHEVRGICNAYQRKRKNAYQKISCLLGEGLVFEGVKKELELVNNMVVHYKVERAEKQIEAVLSELDKDQQKEVLDWIVKNYL